LVAAEEALTLCRSRLLKMTPAKSSKIAEPALRLLALAVVVITVLPPPSRMAGYLLVSCALLVFIFGVPRRVSNLSDRLRRASKRSLWSALAMSFSKHPEARWRGFFPRSEPRPCFRRALSS